MRILADLSDTTLLQDFGYACVYKDIHHYPHFVVFSDGWNTSWIKLHDGQWYVTDDSGLYFRKDVRKFLDNLAVTVRLIQND